MRVEAHKAEEEAAKKEGRPWSLIKLSWYQSSQLPLSLGLIPIIYLSWSPSENGARAKIRKSISYTINVKYVSMRPRTELACLLILEDVSKYSSAQCKLCGKLYQGMGSLEEHIEKVHENPAKEVEGEATMVTE